MTKIVINDCYGGFSLSKEAIKRYNAEGFDPYRPSIEHRTDPALIAIVEELGLRANGMCAWLAIVDIPAGSHYRIHEYDGYEIIELRDQIEWSVA